MAEIEDPELRLALREAARRGRETQKKNAAKKRAEKRALEAEMKKLDKLMEEPPPRPEPREREDMSVRARLERTIRRLEDRLDDPDVSAATTSQLSRTLLAALGQLSALDSASGAPEPSNEQAESSRTALSEFERRMRERETQRGSAS